jgi:hypothetical protein
MMPGTLTEVPCPGQEGRVIGKGGQTIKEIERQSGANMKVEKGSGKCVVHGPRNKVIVARQMVGPGATVSPRRRTLDLDFLNQVALFDGPGWCFSPRHRTHFGPWFLGSSSTLLRV